VCVELPLFSRGVAGVAHRTAWFRQGRWGSRAGRG
jgi:hypothetical protein